MLTQTNKSALLIILAVVMVLSFGSGYYFGQTGEMAIQKQAREEMLKEIFGPASLGSSLNGKVLSIAADKKSFTAEIGPAGFFGVSLPKDYRSKKIIIGQNARIILRQQKDPDIFDKELQELQKKAGNQTFFSGSVAANVPIPFTEQEMEIEDLNINDRISFSLAPKEGATVLDSSLVAAEIIVDR